MVWRLETNEIEVWLEKRLGEGNRFEQFNRGFCQALTDAQLRKILDLLCAEHKKFAEPTGQYIRAYDEGQIDMLGRFTTQIEAELKQKEVQNDNPTLQDSLTTL